MAHLFTWTDFKLKAVTARYNSASYYELNNLPSFVTGASPSTTSSSQSTTPNVGGSPSNTKAGAGVQISIPTYVILLLVLIAANI